MVAIKMSNAPVVVAETALTLSRGTPLGWVCIMRKNSSACGESGQCGQRIDNRTYSDLIYDAPHRPERDIAIKMVTVVIVEMVLTEREHGEVNNDKVA